jgi:hypothetical protein
MRKPHPFIFCDKSRRKRKKTAGEAVFSPENLSLGVFPKQNVLGVRSL